MKKFLLSLTVVASAFASQAQDVVTGVSPAAVQGNYEYSNQTHEFWPGQVGDGSTFPQVVRDGINLGGCTETVTYLQENSII